jgi:hypothetical protein
VGLPRPPLHPRYDDSAVPALILLATVAWGQGDLPTARFALKHSLTIDPTDEFADAIHGAIKSGADATSLLPTVRKARDDRRARTESTENTGPHAD